MCLGPGIRAMSCRCIASISNGTQVSSGTNSSVLGAERVIVQQREELLTRDGCSGGTFFPKITLKIYEFVANYEKLAPQILSRPISNAVPLTGTVKILGVHLDLDINRV